MNRRLLIASSVVALLGLTIAFRGNIWDDDPNAAREQSLRVGFSKLRISLPVFVAKEMGLFEKHGLNVELESFDTAQPLMQALVEGKIDVGGYTALPITFNGMLRSDKDLLFLTTMVEDESHPISFLLRRKPDEGASPAINDIKDLRGKTIGILPTVAYKSWLEVILRENGVEPGSYTIQQIAPQQQAMTLKSGGVDALFTNDPAATATIVQGIGEPIIDEAIIPKYFPAPFLFGSFNVSAEWARENPEVFEKLVAALDEAVVFTNNHPAEAKKAMLAYLPENLHSHVQAYADAKYQTTSETDPVAYQAVVDEYLSLGMIEKSFNIEPLIVTPSFVESVQLELVH